MAKSPIVLYVMTTEEGDTCCGGVETLSAYGLDEKALLASLGEALQKHEVVLRDRFTQAQEIEVARAVTVLNPSNGLQTIDESKRPGAMVEQYVACWTFTDPETGRPLPATAAGYARLEPVVAREVFQRLYARVFPGLAASPDFFTEILNAAQKRSSPPLPSDSPTSE